MLGQQWQQETPFPEVGGVPASHERRRLGLEAFSQEVIAVHYSRHGCMQGGASLYAAVRWGWRSAAHF
jgi:hypothetical protein